MRTLCAELEPLSRPYRHCFVRLLASYRLPQLAKLFVNPSNTERQDEEESSAAPGCGAAKAAVSHQAFPQQADPDLRPGAAHGGVRCRWPPPSNQRIRPAGRDLG
ncbi:hypothetical protein EPR50_G00232530 [Perca flavescens]|uniref:Uncharacterized protein n=1 Tax=Perca flavescens TaxID=8167 RepID=A0A484C570_PERFV|nr:hypothetical protein EPR50_G00232530 [Perca flavescens]